MSAMIHAALAGCVAALVFVPRVQDAVHVVPRGADFGDEFKAVHAGMAGDAIALQGGSLTSVAAHEPPLEIEYEVKADGSQVVLGFGADRITFQPESDPTMLRVEGGAAGGRDAAGAGELPLDRFATIRQTVTKDAMLIAVDGVVRGRWDGAFSAAPMPVRISAAPRATLLVRAIRFQSAASAAPKDSSASAAMPDARVARGKDFDDDFIAVDSARLESALVTRGLVESMRAYEPPLQIEFRVKTDSKNVRLGYAAKEIIFNWEMDPGELRIDGGPAGGQHLEGKGRIPENEFVTIRQVVRGDRMEVFVDGERRAEWKARFKDVKQPVRIFGEGSTLTIESIRIKPLPH